MDREFKRWMKWYGKKHGEYTVSWCQTGNDLYSHEHVFLRINQTRNIDHFKNVKENMRNTVRLVLKCFWRHYFKSQIFQNKMTSTYFFSLSQTFMVFAKTQNN